MGRLFFICVLLLCCCFCGVNAGRPPKKPDAKKTAARKRTLPTCEGVEVQPKKPRGTKCACCGSVDELLEVEELPAYVGQYLRAQDLRTSVCLSCLAKKGQTNFRPTNNKVRCSVSNYACKNLATPLCSVPSTLDREFLAREPWSIPMYAPVFSICNACRMKLCNNSERTPAELHSDKKKERTSKVAKGTVTFSKGHVTFINVFPDHFSFF